MLKTQSYDLETNFSPHNAASIKQTLNSVKFKKIALFFCLLLFSVLLTGCANITYSRVLHPGGMVSDKVIVTLNTEKLEAANISVHEITQEIKDDIDLLFFANVRLYSTHLELLATPESLLEKEQIVIGIEPPTTENEIVATINFKTRSAFNNYNNWMKLMQEQQNPEETPQENNSDQQNVTTSQSFFYTTHTQTSNSVFNQELFTTITPLLKYQSKYSGNGLSFSDLSFSQIYGSTDTHLRSNADYVAVINNIKLHQWNITTPLSDNNPMKFYTLIPNTANWYISALAISLSVGIIVLFAGLIENKTKIIIAKRQ